MEKWIIKSFLAMIFLLGSNFCISIMGTKAGPSTMFYYSSGTCISGVIWNIYNSVVYHREHQTYWVPQNFKVDGKYNFKNIFGFLLFTVSLFLVQYTAVLDIYFANQANVNTGIITIIWRTAIFITALFDYVMNGTKLQYFHWIGLVACMLCTIFMGVSKIVYTDEASSLNVAILPVWIPLVFAIAMALFISINAMQIKNLGNNGFDSAQITWNALMIFNGIVLFFAAIPYWSHHQFYPDLFVIGFIGGSVSSTALSFLNQAFTCGGPAGPVTAISAMSSPSLVVVMAIVNSQMISSLELIGCILGMYGALLMSNHTFFENNCFCCCIKSKNQDQKINDENLINN